MYKGITLVMAVWHIIIGGWIFFLNGNGWCIKCGSSLLIGLGVVSILLGLAGIVNGLRGSGAAAGR